jgi:hypothetical protein
VADAPEPPAPAHSTPGSWVCQVHSRLVGRQALAPGSGPASLHGQARGEELGAGVCGARLQRSQDNPCLVKGTLPGEDEPQARHRRRLAEPPLAPPRLSPREERARLSAEVGLPPE